MFPDVKWCGRKIRLVAALRAPRRARSACFAIGCVVMLLVVIAIILGAIVLSRGLLMIPLMSAMSARRRARRVATPRVARPVVSCIWLSRGALGVGHEVIALRSISEISRVGRELRVRAKLHVTAIDLRMLDDRGCDAFVRHIEARRKLVRMRDCARDVAKALEAFYVYDAHAVLVRDKNAPSRNVDIVCALPIDEPFPRLEANERIYVRTEPRGSSPYREASANVIVIGSLR